MLRDVLAATLLVLVASPLAHAQRGEGATFGGGDAPLGTGVAGSCCLIDGSCVDVAGLDECNALQGVFLEGTICGDDPCGVGACCFDTNCVQADAYNCIAGGREFAGAGTSCLDDPCDVGVGACCMDDTCVDLSTEDCAAIGGTWLGPGSSWPTNPCTPGACCVNEACIELAAHECEAQQGEFHPGLICEEVNCLPPDDCPANTLFSQNADDPDDFVAGTSEASAGFRRFEDFTFVDGPIVELTWWGLDLEHLGGNNFVECVESDPTFEIAFHADAAGFPGAEVCSYTLLATRTPTGILYLGAELNEYHVVLPTSCVLTNGWVSIVGLGEPQCWFLWMSAGLFGSSYCDGCAPSSQDFDLALCLQGTSGGVFGACCDDAAGICIEGVEITDCADPSQRFLPDGTCADFDPPCATIIGACCFEDDCQLMTDADCSAAEGVWLGANSQCAQCPCIINCDGSDEGEGPCFDGYVDTFNAGCSAASPSFTPIALGETVCGLSGVYMGPAEIEPDQDWYAATFTEDTMFTWTVRAPYSVQVLIIDGSEGCPGVIVAQATSQACQEVSLSADAEPGEIIWLVQFPILFKDEAGCGAMYRATLSEVLPTCPWDLNGDGAVDAADLAALLDAWGPNPGHPADFTSDGVVDAADLAQLLDHWGPC